LVLLTPIALEGTEWVVTGYNNGKGGVVSVVSGTELTASFADGGVAGSAGCNDYRAGYEIEGESLRIGPAGSTKKMCSGPEGIMEQEAQFLAALSSATVYRIEGDNLELRREDGSLAVKASARP
jgi:heat shock protein HslJ